MVGAAREGDGGLRLGAGDPGGPGWGGGQARGECQSRGTALAVPTSYEQSLREEYWLDFCTFSLCQRRNIYTVVLGISEQPVKKHNPV